MPTFRYHADPVAFAALGESWPSCCDDPAGFVMPAGIAEIRARGPGLEGQVLSHLVYEMGLSGGAATRLLNSLDRDRGPTAYVFHCPRCETYVFYIDQSCTGADRCKALKRTS